MNDDLKDLSVLPQPWIDRLALQRQHGEHAFMNPPQRLAGDEAFQGLVAKREFAQRKIGA